jgi:uncharacterized integral membrane protein
MHKAKAIALAVLFALIVIVVVQNTEQVQTRILFITIEMPRAVLLAVTALLGFLFGLLVGLRKGAPKIVPASDTTA